MKALTYFADGDLPNLSFATQNALRALATQVNLKHIPLIEAKVGVSG